MAGAISGDLFIGRKAQELRGLLKLSWPMENGIVRPLVSSDQLGKRVAHSLMSSSPLLSRSRTGTTWSGYGSGCTRKSWGRCQKKFVSSRASPRRVEHSYFID